MTLKLVARAEDPTTARAGDLTTALGRGASAGRRLDTLPVTGRRPVAPPKPGSLAWLRAINDDRYRRGALVRVRGVEGKFFITSSAVNTLGQVMVRVWPVQERGPRMNVLPAEVFFDQ